MGRLASSGRHQCAAQVAKKHSWVSSQGSSLCAWECVCVCVCVCVRVKKRNEGCVSAALCVKARRSVCTVPLVVPWWHLGAWCVPVTEILPWW